MHTIASNAGVEGAVVVGKLLEQDNPDLGYDAAKGFPLSNIFYLHYYLFGVTTNQIISLFYIVFNCEGEYVDMVKAGIIDPLKVIRTALVDAAR